MKRIAIPLIASLSLAAGAAWARDKPSFDALDNNNDNRLSRAEYAGTAPAKVKARKDADPGFNRLDRNNDGYLSRAEASRNQYLIERFNAADKNDDGRLNRAEYLATMTRKDVRSGVAKLEQRREQRSAAAGTTRQPSLP